MDFLFIIILILLGLVAASTFFAKKLPQTKTIVDLVQPYVGWTGLISMVLGIFWLVRMIAYIGALLKHAPISALVSLASVLIMIVLGFLLSQKLIKQFSKDNKKADEFVQKMNDKFLPFQEKIGLAAVGLGLAGLVLAII